MPDNKHNYEYNYDLGDVIDNAVQMGSKIGSSVLGSIADALEQAGDAMGMKQPDTFAAWKRRLERKWKNGGQSVGVVLTAVGWTFAGCFGIAAPYNATVSDMAERSSKYHAASCTNAAPIPVVM